MNTISSTTHATPHELRHPVNAESSQENVVISVKQISKKFCRNLKRSMAYGIMDLGKSLLGIKPDTTTLRKDEFWALDNLSFELRHGDSLGIVGANGSGKTTLLRVLTGIFPPDAGEIAIQGRIGALVAVGAGFHPHMTGRENIYLNGAILGMSKKEIDANFKSIVEFAEIGDFIDAPVSTYSSGMYVRLGFAVAIHCKPDILLVDEVLSVGDLGFRNKSLRRMAEYREQAKALIFISHNLEQVRVLCNRVIILDKGKILYDGMTHEGCVQHEEMSRVTRLNSLKKEPDGDLKTDEKFQRRISSDDLDVIDFGILDSNGQKTDCVGMHEPLRLFYDFEIKRSVEGLYFSASVLNQELKDCIWVMSNDNRKASFTMLSAGQYRLNLRIPQHHLIPNIYIPNIAIRNSVSNETYERILSNYSFRVVSDGQSLERGIVAVQEEWELVPRASEHDVPC